jgi:hypothetical protein
MTPPETHTGPVALVTRLRDDAQVFKRYGATGRARMLEQIAAEVERSTADESAAVVGMRAAVALTGFSRGHLRRLYREGRLLAAGLERGEPVFRVSDLPRKPAARPTAARPAPVSRAQFARELVRAGQAA